MSKSRTVTAAEVDHVMASVAAAHKAGKRLPEALKELGINHNRYAYLRSWDKAHKRANSKSNGSNAPDAKPAFNRNGEIHRLEQENARLTRELEAANQQVLIWQAKFGQLAAQRM